MDGRDAAADLTVAAADESRHAPWPDPLWSESHYLHFSHHDGGLGGFVRLALHPPRNLSEAIVCLYLPDGRVGVTRLHGGLEQPDDRTVRAGTAAFVCVDPLKHWRVLFDGELFPFRADELQAGATPDPTAPGRRVRLDLDATGVHAPLYYPPYKKVADGPPHRPIAPLGFARRVTRAMRRPAEVRSALNMRKARHYEQSMVVGGSVTVDGDAMEFSGTGHRDHSWGPRDWMPSERWRWLTGEVGGLAFSAMYLTIAGTHVTNGYVWSEGRAASVDRLQLESTFDDTGLGLRTLSMELTAGGRSHLITGDTPFNVSQPITGPHFSTVYTVGRTRYRCGERTGYGVAESLERLYP
jgi:hypothetical protein